MGTIETSLLRQFIWHLAKSNQTYGYGDNNCQENSEGGAGGAGVGAGAGEGETLDSNRPINLNFKLQIINALDFLYSHSLKDYGPFWPLSLPNGDIF